MRHRGLYAMSNEIDNYYVCFIDLMGQKRIFTEVKSVTPDPDTMQQIIRVSDGLREIVRYVKNRYARNFMVEDDVGIELFSDSILLSIKARQKIPERLHVWLAVIVKIVYIVCKFRLPFRGGIACGHAARTKSGMIYGMAVDEAIRIEEVCADYPRIVLAHTLVDDFIENASVEKFFTIDSDSAYILNYAGWKLMEKPEFVKERECCRQILDWVLSCYDSFRYTDDSEHNKNASPKLARRYFMWSEYLRLEEMYRGQRNV